MKHIRRLLGRNLGSDIALALTVTAILATGTGAWAQSAEKIVTQPARDVGIEKAKISELLLEAAKDPYATAGTERCAQISAAIAALTGVIGPDFSTTPNEKKPNIAALGGAAVVNSLIPFRGIVREVSGASAQERRENAAIDAGIARRGFLRGLKLARKCRK